MKNIRRIISLAALIPLLAWAGQDADEARLKPQWQQLDKNNDGLVALSELHPMLAGSMVRSDVDGDGTISLAEYVSYDLDPGGASRTPLADNVRLIRDLPYASTNDPRQSLDLYLPKMSSVDGPLPVIVYIHGGAWRMGSKVSARNQLNALIDSGRYAGASIGYRLTWQDSWPAQIHDVKAGIRWIRANAEKYGLDASRICAMGGSAGGHLVAILGTTNGTQAVEGELGGHADQSSDVQCAIDLFGPADLTDVRIPGGDGGLSPEEMLLGARPQEVPEKASEASPLTHVDSEDVPFMVIHGTKDPLVNYTDSVELVAALKDVGVPVVFQTIEGGGHGDFGQAMGPLNERMVLFLEKNFYDSSVQVPSDLLKHSP